MATHREIFTHHHRTITLAMDDDPPIGQRMWAVVKMQLIDELTGRPPSDTVRLETTQTRLSPRAAEGGIVGLVANPFAAFPDLANQPYPFDITIRANGYLPVQIQDQVAQAPAFPADFVPRDLGRVELHAAPVALRGQVVRRTPAGVVTALAGATVEVTHFWPQAPTLLVNPPGTRADILALNPPLYANWTAGGVNPGQLRRRTMTVNLGQDKVLASFATAGSTRVDLSDGVQALAGRFLAIEPDVPERMEVMEIASVEGGLTPQAPASATLTYPLAFSHARGVVVQRVNLAPAGFTKNITRNASAGDSSIYLNNLTAVVPTIVEVGDGVAPPEFHAFRRYATTTGADGYYRLPPIHRAAMLTLRAQMPPLADVELNFAPRYGQSENRLDFVFRQ